MAEVSEAGEGFGRQAWKRFTVGTVKGMGWPWGEVGVCELDVDLPMGFMQRSVTIQLLVY